MLFFVRFDIHQPEGMSTRELIEIWDREADAALAAMEAGAVTHLWKVSGQRVVFAVLDLPDAETLDRALAGLPIVQELGGSAKTEALPIYDYATFAGDLKAALAAGP
jgi:muconolactone delta-isomerase